MKTATKVLILSSFLSLFGVGISRAQQSVSIISDSLSKNECPLPASIFAPVNGNATNYNAATDSIYVEYFWGDGTSTGDSVQLFEAGVTDYWNAYETHNYTLSGVYQIMIIATAYNGVADTFYWNDSVNAAPGCTQISGQVYVDQNANCSYDLNVDSTLGAILTVTDANGGVVDYAWANYSTGSYSFSIPNNLTNLSITATRWPAFTTQCPASGFYTFNSNASQTFDFGIECDSLNLDKRSYVWGYAGAPGDTGLITFLGRAYHCGFPNITQDTFILTLDNNVSYLGTPPWSQAPAPDVVSGNTLTWYRNLNSGPYFTNIIYGRIWTLTDTSATLGDTACYMSDYASIPSQEVSPNNNHNTWCWPIGVPYDPNNKLVFPQGQGPEGNIDTSIHRLTYMINFQNTGSAPAQDVYVLDTLPSELVLESIEIIESSHNMKLIHQQNNRIRFDFPNINLPDSASDEEGSKGYVIFSINRDPNLNIGDQIKNRVGIYFDYQPVVMTEYAVNTLYEAPETPDEPDSLVLHVDGSDVTCMNYDNGMADLSIVSGNPPYTYQWSNGSTTQDLMDLSPGTYDVTVTDSEQFTAEGEVSIGENRIHPDPIVGAISGSMSVEAWKSYIYTVDLTAGSTYQWDAAGGEVLDVANNQAEILWYAGPEGTIMITERDGNGCYGNSETLVPIIFVGIPEGDLDELKVFPNPTSGELNLQLPEGSHQADLKLYDMQGRVMIQDQLRSQNHSINLSKFSAGVYWLNVTAGEQSARVKVMVQ